MDLDCWDLELSGLGVKALLLLALGKLTLTLSSVDITQSGSTSLGFSHTGPVLSSSFPLPFPLYVVLKALVHEMPANCE